MQVTDVRCLLVPAGTGMGKRAATALARTLAHLPALNHLDLDGTSEQMTCTGVECD